MRAAWNSGLAVRVRLSSVSSNTFAPNVQNRKPRNCVPHNLTLYGVGTSRTIRAHWMLAELGLDYECRPIQSRTGETLAEEFLRLNPRHKIPVLQHVELVLTESAAIVQYLSEAFANPNLIYVPRDTAARAALSEWCFFIMTELDAGSLYVVRRHEGLPHLYGEAPTAVESAKKYFSHNLEAMTPRIARAPYLFGDRVSSADILLGTCLEWALISKIALPAEIMEYRQRLTQRPAFQVALKKNFPQTQS
jgi:glutathione S-transferase